MKIFLIGVLAIVPGALSAHTVHPDMPKTVTLSNTDVNRIVCKDGLVNDVFYSQEKGLTVVNKDGNAFVKYLVKSTPDGNEYVTTSTELHIVCDGKTYTLIAQPSQVNAKTIVLTGGIKGRVSKNIAEYGGLDHEERILSLTRQVYRNEIDDNLVVKHKTKRIKIAADGRSNSGFYESFDVTETRQVLMEGVNLKATEYQLTALFDVKLEETDFLRHELGHSIAGITLSKRALKSGESARLIVVTNEVN